MNACSSCIERFNQTHTNRDSEQRTIWWLVMIWTIEKTRKIKQNQKKKQTNKRTTKTMLPINISHFTSCLVFFCSQLLSINFSLNFNLNEFLNARAAMSCCKVIIVMSFNSTFDRWVDFPFGFRSHPGLEVHVFIWYHHMRMNRCMFEVGRSYQDLSIISKYLWYRFTICRIVKVIFGAIHGLLAFWQIRFWPL